MQFAGSSLTLRSFVAERRRDGRALPFAPVDIFRRKVQAEGITL